MRMPHLEPTAWVLDYKTENCDLELNPTDGGSEAPFYISNQNV